MTQMLLDSSLSDSQEEFASTVAESANSLNAIAGAMAEFSTFLASKDDARPSVDANGKPLESLADGPQSHDAAELSSFRGLQGDRHGFYYPGSGGNQ